MRYNARSPIRDISGNKNERVRSLMKVKLQRVFSLLLVLMLAFGCTFLTAYAEEDDVLPDEGEMDLDVVFVLDASGSMLSSDPNRIALDAFNLFVDLCDESCGVGYSVYTEKIKATGKIVDIKDSKALTKVKKEIAGLEYDPYGDTDIALGLTNAMKIFQEQKEADRKKNRAIILLSDGNTHLLNGPRTLEASKKELKETLGKLNEMKIPVYTIGLNYDGTLDKNETYNISQSTGGKSFETKSSSELTGITSDIFSDIYKIEGTKREIDKGGNVKIIIRDNSVFYVNIIIRSQYSYSQLNPSLLSPLLKDVPLKDNENVKVTSTPSYTLIKLIYPDSGTYHLHLDNADSSNCTVTQLDFYSVYVSQSIPKNATLGKPVTLKANLKNKDAVVDDTDLLKTMSMITTVQRENGDKQEIELVRDSLGNFSAEFTPVAIGKYLVTTNAVTETFQKQSLTVEMEVGIVDEEPSVTPTYETEDKGGGDLSWIGPAGGYLIVIGGVVALGIILVAVFRSRKQKALISTVQSVSRQEPPKPAPAPKPTPVRKPAPKVENVKPSPKAEDPDLVDIPLLEHESLDKLIKKGTDDAFSTKSADDFATNVELEKLIKKGSEDPFHANADSYEVDPSLAALIKTGGNGLEGNKIQQEETNPDEDGEEGGSY